MNDEHLNDTKSLLILKVPLIEKLRIKISVLLTIILSIAGLVIFSKPNEFNGSLCTLVLYRAGLFRDYYDPNSIN